MHTLVLPHQSASFERKGEVFLCNQASWEPTIPTNVLIHPSLGPFSSSVTVRNEATSAARLAPPVWLLPSGDREQEPVLALRGRGEPRSPAVLGLSLIHISEPTRPY